MAFGAWFALIGETLPTVGAAAATAGGGFGGLIFLFAKRQALKLTSVIAREFGADEVVLSSGLASHFKGPEAVGGLLFLTARRVRFISHRLNVQTHDESFALADIVGVDETRTLGIVPNGVVLLLRDGRRERFVVNNRAAWVEKLHDMRARHPEGATARLIGHVPATADVVPMAIAEPAARKMH